MAGRGGQLRQAAIERRQRLGEGGVQPGVQVGGLGFAVAGAQAAALQSLMDDGTYLKILEHWSAESGAITEATINAGTSPGDEE